MIALWTVGLAGCTDKTTPPADTPTETGTAPDSETPTSEPDSDSTPTTPDSTDTGTAPVFAVSSPDMTAHAGVPCLQQLPTQFWCTGQGGTNLNPEITWEGAPKGTVTFALTLEDASIGFFDHWGVFNIDATATGIAQAASGTNPTAAMPLGAEQIGPYAGSCSNGMNTYRWRVFALDATIDVNVNEIADIEQFAMTHALGVATMCHCPPGDCFAY